MELVKQSDPPLCGKDTPPVACQPRLDYNSKQNGSVTSPQNEFCDFACSPRSFLDQHRYLDNVYNQYPNPEDIPSLELERISKQASLTMAEVLQWLRDEKSRREKLLIALPSMSNDVRQAPCSTKSPKCRPPSSPIVQDVLPEHRPKRGRPPKTKRPAPDSTLPTGAKRQKCSIELLCLECKTLHTPERWNEHMGRVHFPNHVYECPKSHGEADYQCEAFYKRSDNFRSHLVTHGYRPDEISELMKTCKFKISNFFHHTCGFCQRKLRSREASFKHIKNHLFEISQRADVPNDLGASEWKESCGVKHTLCRGIHYCIGDVVKPKNDPAAEHFIERRETSCQTEKLRLDRDNQVQRPQPPPRMDQRQENELECLPDKANDTKSHPKSLDFLSIAVDNAMVTSSTGDLVFNWDNFDAPDFTIQDGNNSIMPAEGSHDPQFSFLDFLETEQTMRYGTTPGTSATPYFDTAAPFDFQITDPFDFSFDDLLEGESAFLSQPRLDLSTLPSTNFSNSSTLSIPTQTQQVGVSPILYPAISTGGTELTQYTRTSGQPKMHYQTPKCTCGYEPLGKRYSNLLRHQRTCKQHSALIDRLTKAFKCDLCDKKFARSDNLHMHRQRKHAEYKCDVCDKTFHKELMLKMHRRKLHAKRRSSPGHDEMTMMHDSSNVV